MRKVETMLLRAVIFCSAPDSNAPIAQELAKFGTRGCAKEYVQMNFLLIHKRTGKYSCDAQTTQRADARYRVAAATQFF